ncbi:MAG: Phasin [Rhodobacteraceae bacterium]|nr:Phasin [Paracoccaceae bacterium]
MAAKTQDYTKLFQDMMASFPLDAAALQDAFRTSAAFGEKMSKVALEAADKSTEISAKWTKSTLAKLGEVSKAKSEPTEYTKALTDFASAQAEAAAETLAAFAEVAKKVQMETVELMLAAGKDFSEDASAAMKKATSEMTSAAKKVAAAAK